MNMGKRAGGKGREGSYFSFHGTKLILIPFPDHSIRHPMYRNMFGSQGGYVPVSLCAPCPALCRPNHPFRCHTLIIGLELALAFLKGF